jgi:hypothetical protein
MEPLMDGKSTPNVYDEHVFKVRVTLGAGTVFTSLAKDVTVTRPSATTLKLVLPKAYTEITSYYVGRKAAAAVAGLEWIITTNNIATDGSVTLTSIVAAGTATAPASGDVAYITLGASCATLNSKFTGSGS